MSYGVPLGGWPRHPTINITWEASVNGADARFKGAIQQAVNNVTSQIFDSGTYLWTVGYGTLHGVAMSGGLGASEDPSTPVAYSTIAAKLTANAKSANALSAVASLPGSWTGTTKITLMQYRLFGLGAVGQSYSGFSSSASWAYDGNPSGSQYDLISVAMHELTEVMGRLCGADSWYNVPDLYCFQSAGVRNTGNSFSSPNPRYFSADNGTTSLNSYNKSLGAGDAGDWVVGAAPHSPFEVTGTIGAAISLQPGDLILLDCLGWPSVPL